MVLPVSVKQSYTYLQGLGNSFDWSALIRLYQNCLSPKEVSWNEVIYKDKIKVCSRWSKGSWYIPSKIDQCGENICNLTSEGLFKTEKKMTKINREKGAKT